MFTLEIETDSGAFKPYPGVEVARILREAAKLLEQGDRGASLFASNSLIVGRFKLTRED